MAKFRGGSDDWLDDENSSRRGVAKPKKKSSKATTLDASLANATVVEVFPKQARARMDTDGVELLCSYRRAQVIQNDENYRERSPVAVGDRVQASQLNPQDGVIEGVCERRNSLARPAPGKDEGSNIFHVIAANIDLLTIVASTKLPDFSPGLVDRYLIAAQAAGIDSLICVTKVDLIEAPEGLWDEYRKIGYPVVLISAKAELGIKELFPKIEGKTVVFCGHSGVGKTSLFRKIIGTEVGKIGEVNVLTGKGRHTTTSAILYPRGDSKWIDTPGIREFGLVGVTPENLASYFPEFTKLACTARDCSHIDQENCDAVVLFRHPSFLRIHQSLVELTLPKE
jgi:ribosome biogenesis GTPase / thiamine phosphate phosphatase